MSTHKLTDRAREIIDSSLTGGFPIDVDSISPLKNKPKQVKVVLSVTNWKKMEKFSLESEGVSTSHESTLRSILEDNYGESAADTWMEGDITLEGGKELYLEFVKLERYKTCKQWLRITNMRVRKDLNSIEHHKLPIQVMTIPPTARMVSLRKWLSDILHGI